LPRTPRGSPRPACLSGARRLDLALPPRRARAEGGAGNGGAGRCGPCCQASRPQGRRGRARTGEAACAACARARRRERAREPLCARRRAHLLGDEQWAYNDWLAAAAGADVPRLPAWRRRMYEATGDSKAALPDSYRDGTAYAPDLLAEVAADLARQQRALAAAVA